MSNSAFKLLFLCFSFFKQLVSVLYFLCRRRCIVPDILEKRDENRPILFSDRQITCDSTKPNFKIKQQIFTILFLFSFFIIFSILLPVVRLSLLFNFKICMEDFTDPGWPSLVCSCGFVFTSDSSKSRNGWKILARSSLSVQKVENKSQKTSKEKQILLFIQNIYPLLIALNLLSICSLKRGGVRMFCAYSVFSGTQRPNLSKHVRNV